MQTIHVAFASDNNYAQHMAVSIASLLKNAGDDYFINLYILYEDISDAHILKLRELGTLRPNTQILFLKLSLDDFKDYPLHTGLHSIATYFRLKLASLLPDVNHIAYLDSDIVVCDDIARIWDNFVHSSQMLWAVEEPTPLYEHRLKSLGMNPDSPYFNGGILLLNLEKMRQNHFEEKSKDYINQYAQYIRYQDQDVLNALSEGDWKPLPLRWNSFFFVLEGIYKGKYKSYSDSDILEARDNPAIIHYNQHPKPWAEACIDPRRKAYFKYLEYTAYKGFKVNQTKSCLPILENHIRSAILSINVHMPALYRLLRYVKRAVLPLPRGLAGAQVTAIIKTFERPDKVIQLHKSLRNYYPELKVVIIDDSSVPMSYDWGKNTEYIHTEYDIGLSQGRNLAVSKVNTPYTLLLDDDFLFTEQTKIMNFVDILAGTDFQIVAGEVLDFGKKRLVFKGMMEVVNDTLFLNNYKRGKKVQGHICYDFVLNFFLARTQLLRDNPWDNELKIREHEEFFWRLRSKGVLITSTSNVSISHFPTSDTVVDGEEYFQKRINRIEYFHTLACQKIGVKGFRSVGARYYGFGVWHFLIYLKLISEMRRDESVLWMMAYKLFSLAISFKRYVDSKVSQVF